MALEACVLQVTTIATTRACSLQAHHLPFSSKEKTNLKTCKGLKKIGFTLSTQSSSSSSFASSIHQRGGRGSQIICKARNATDEVLVVTDANWKNLVIGNESPVLVEFWAPWCGPCRMIAPVIDELAKEYAGKIACYKVNTDDCPSIATEYGIRSIPTVLVFKDGEKKESIIGAVPKSTLTTTIEKYLEV
ncbi:thioredoxin-like [Tasmannia lanceolata]|uniref:thioredoxin-like n=1 Tax=Tasmannia lanceolata TaxID=3420 RepID=UPI0040648025